MGNMPGAVSTTSFMAGMTIPTQQASNTMASVITMASAIAEAPQAGMLSMADMKNMCSLPGMKAMCLSNTSIVIGLCAALLALATIAVMLRLISRWLSALPFWYDDAAILLSLVRFELWCQNDSGTERSIRYCHMPALPLLSLV